MEIRTKYNIGDVIWVIDNTITDKYFVDCFIIGDIICNIENDINNLIIYIAYSRKNSFHHIVEKDCFSTREEAEKECNRRNKEQK